MCPWALSGTTRALLLLVKFVPEYLFVVWTFSYKRRESHCTNFLPLPFSCSSGHETKEKTLFRKRRGRKKKEEKMLQGRDVNIRILLYFFIYFFFQRNKMCEKKCPGFFFFFFLPVSQSRLGRSKGKLLFVFVASLPCIPRLFWLIGCCQMVFLFSKVAHFLGQSSTTDFYTTKDVFTSGRKLAACPTNPTCCDNLLGYILCSATTVSKHLVTCYVQIAVLATCWTPGQHIRCSIPCMSYYIWSITHIKISMLYVLVGQWYS